jgi:hypothetical protein
MPKHKDKQISITLSPNLTLSRNKDGYADLRKYIPDERTTVDVEGVVKLGVPTGPTARQALEQRFARLATLAEHELVEVYARTTHEGLQVLVVLDEAFERSADGLTSKDVKIGMLEANLKTTRDGLEAKINVLNEKLDDAEEDVRAKVAECDKLRSQLRRFETNVAIARREIGDKRWRELCASESADGARDRRGQLKARSYWDGSLRRYVGPDDPQWDEAKYLDATKVNG